MIDDVARSVMRGIAARLVREGNDDDAGDETPGAGGHIDVRVHRDCEGGTAEMTVLWRRWSGSPAQTPVHGRYRLLERIGSGSFGTVWRADDIDQPGRVVALKQSRPIDDGPGSQRRRERALREGEHAGRLADEPNVIAVYDTFDEDGHVWLVEEFFDSLSLEQLLVERGHLEPSEVAWIGQQVAEAVAAAHALGIVHRDIAPANILVARGGEIAKLADFGVARHTGAPDRTMEGTVLGHPAYLSPDEAHGGSATVESDVFSLGSVLYHAVEGRPPFGDDRDGQLLNRIRGGRPDPPQRAGELGPVLLDMLQPASQSRPTADDVAERLHGLDGSLGETSRAVLREHRPPIHEPTVDPRPRPGFRVPAVALMVLGLVAAVAFAVAMVVPVVRDASSESAAPTTVYGEFLSTNADDLRIGPPTLLRPASAGPPNEYRLVAVLGRGPEPAPDDEVPGTHLVYDFFCSGRGDPGPCGGVLRSHYITTAPTAPDGLWPSPPKGLGAFARLYDTTSEGGCDAGRTPVFRYERRTAPARTPTFRIATTPPGPGWEIGENLGCVAGP